MPIVRHIFRADDNFLVRLIAKTDQELGIRTIVKHSIIV